MCMISNDYLSTSSNNNWFLSTIGMTINVIIHGVKSNDRGLIYV